MRRGVAGSGMASEILVARVRKALEGLDEEAARRAMRAGGRHSIAEIEMLTTQEAYAIIRAADRARGDRDAETARGE